jgi:hypothetical protein
MDFKNNTRGFRNNNPGNIRLGNDWKGEKDGDDQSFEVFTSIEYGIRALFKLIKNYASKYQCFTIEDVIKRYAPPSENDTRQYVKSVYDYMYEYSSSPQQLALYHDAGKTAFLDNGLLPLFVAAIINHENGFQPFNITFIRNCEAL